jgi:hypothetical protein
MFRWFPHLCKPTVDTGDIHLFEVKLTKYEAIHIEDLEFTANHSNILSLSPMGDDFGAIVGGMAHRGTPSQHPILKEPLSEDDLASSMVESSGFPVPRSCNAVISVIPITTTPPPEEIPVPLTIPVRP